MALAADHYRGKAKECEQAAERLEQGSSAREHYLQLAKRWRQIADDAEYLHSALSSTKRQSNE